MVKFFLKTCFLKLDIKYFFYFFYFMQKKVILCILDGFGIGNKEYKFNAVFQANTPNFQRMLKEYSNTTLHTSGLAVGLPNGQMGNSEVGHMTIGSGRVMYQDLPRINIAIQDGSLNDKISQIQSNTVHLIGLCSQGGVHSSLNHIKYIYNQLEKQGKSVVLHIITDGRDVSPQDFISTINEFNGMNIGTISGRFFAMDRDNKVERTQEYFSAICRSSKMQFEDIKTATQYFYSQNITDEFFNPSVIGKFEGIKTGEAVFFANFRADRMRQITQMVIDCNMFLEIICMTQYSKEIASKTKVLFEQNHINNTLIEVLENNGKTHLHIAETEKYAHVTFFFNGGKEDLGKFEKRILIPSPNVKTYDLQPEMSIYELEKKLLPQIGNFDFIVINIANGDMVGHTGNFEASKQAAQHIDLFLGNLEKSAIENNYDIIITADHGNLEEMVDIKTGEIHTQHTTGVVPLILVSKTKRRLNSGSLANIAGTILDLMGIQKPKEMENGLLV